MMILREIEKKGNFSNKLQLYTSEIYVRVNHPRQRFLEHVIYNKITQFKYKMQKALLELNLTLQRI